MLVTLAKFEEILQSLGYTARIEIGKKGMVLYQKDDDPKVKYLECLNDDIDNILHHIAFNDLEDKIIGGFPAKDLYDCPEPFMDDE